MKIGLLSPSIYMSPTKYKDMIFAPRDLSIALANKLVDRGHTVYFFTAGDVPTKATIVLGDSRLIFNDYIEEKMKNAPSERLKWASFYAVKRNYEMDLTSKCYGMALAGKLDIIHSYHDTLAHFFNDTTSFPTVYTLHDPLPAAEKSVAYWLLDKFSKQNYVSISNAFRKNSNLNLNFVDTVYHGISAREYPFSANPGQYLACIGRMTPEKGIDQAIDVSARTNLPLRIATSSLEENQDIPYFREVIQPKMINNPLATFTGHMSGIDKAQYLGQASCLLFPISWEEPFGMVMIEAMVCGTPVIAYNRGSVAEIVKDGVTGFIIDPDNEERPGKGSWVIKKTGVEGLVEAIKRIGEIDRSACRAHVEQNFTVDKMVEGYEKVYQKLISRNKSQAK